MYQVSKNNGKNFIDVPVLKTFDKFKEAHQWAQENICKDFFNEGFEESIYWFSDQGDIKSPYKVKIEKSEQSKIINQTKI